MASPPTRWIGLAAVATSLALSLGCQPARELEGLRCDDSGGCSQGYACVDAFCVLPGQGDAGQAGDAASRDRRGVDSAAPDRAGSDVEAPDGANLDARGADLGAADHAMADSAVADQRAPDAVVSDLATAVDAGGADSAGPGVDAASSLDAASPADASPVDTGPIDLGKTDSAASDAALPDTWQPDSATPADAVQPDSASADAAIADAAPTDAEPPSMNISPGSSTYAAWVDGRWRVEFTEAANWQASLYSVMERPEQLQGTGIDPVDDPGNLRTGLSQTVLQDPIRLRIGSGTTWHGADEAEGATMEGPTIALFWMTIRANYTLGSTGLDVQVSQVFSTMLTWSTTVTLTNNSGAAVELAELQLAYSTVDRDLGWSFDQQPASGWFGWARSDGASPRGYYYVQHSDGLLTTTAGDDTEGINRFFHVTGPITVPAGGSIEYGWAHLLGGGTPPLP